MHYKTMVLEFLQEQLPTLHEQLRTSKKLLRTVNAHAAYLKSKHDAWMTEFRAMRPDNDPSQFSSEAPPVPARPTYQDRVTRATPGEDFTRLVTDPGFHRSQMMIGRLMMVARTLDSRMTVLPGATSRLREWGRLDDPAGSFIL